MNDAQTGPGPWGDPSLHRPLDELQRDLAGCRPPKTDGTLAQILVRGEASRDTPAEARLTAEEGVVGDRWFRSSPERLETQIAIMRADVARLIANGQPLSLFGDNLLVDLDLGVANIPPGTTVHIGEVELVATPEPHNGCKKFRQRFGGDALKLLNQKDLREQRLRGIYLRVVAGGTVRVGDTIRVVQRPG